MFFLFAYHLFISSCYFSIRLLVFFSFIFQGLFVSKLLSVLIQNIKRRHMKKIPLGLLLLFLPLHWSFLLSFFRILYQGDNLTLHLKQLEKEEMKKPRVSRRKEILKIWAEINAKETKETRAKVHPGSLPFPILYLEIERIFKAKGAKGWQTSEMYLLHQYKLKFT